MDGVEYSATEMPIKLGLFIPIHTSFIMSNSRDDSMACDDKPDYP